MPEQLKPSIDVGKFEQQLKEALRLPSTPADTEHIRQMCGRADWSLKYSMIALEQGEDAAIKAAQADFAAENDPPRP